VHGLHGALVVRLLRLERSVPHGLFDGPVDGELRRLAMVFGRLRDRSVRDLDDLRHVHVAVGLWLLRVDLDLSERQLDRPEQRELLVLGVDDERLRPVRRGFRLRGLHGDGELRLLQRLVQLPDRLRLGPELRLVLRLVVDVSRVSVSETDGPE
jgi:hypothetical protein